MSTAVKHSHCHCHLAVKSPAAAGANLCYIACGAGIIVLPNLSGAFNSDVWTLLAFNMIFLGLASFSFHHNGDLLHHWSHRADLTFILILMGALPCLAANGLKQAWYGEPAPARDTCTLITKAAAIVLGGCVHWPVIPPSLPFPSPPFLFPVTSSLMMSDFAHKLERVGRDDQHIVQLLGGTWGLRGLRLSRPFALLPGWWSFACRFCFIPHVS